MERGNVCTGTPLPAAARPHLYSPGVRGGASRHRPNAAIARFNGTDVGGRTIAVKMDEKAR